MRESDEKNFFSPATQSWSLQIPQEILKKDSRTRGAVPGGRFATFATFVTFATFSTSECIID